MEQEEKKVSIPLVVGGVAIIVVVAAGGIFISLNQNPTNNSNSNGNAQSIGTLVDAPLKVLNPSGTYKDGNYSAIGSYISPAGSEEIEVEVTLKANVITKVTVTPLATDAESQRYETKFAEGISAKVVGKKIDEFQINGRLNGSSLTGTGFNAALERIKTEAKG